MCHLPESGKDSESESGQSTPGEHCGPQPDPQVLGGALRGARSPSKVLAQPQANSGEIQGIVQDCEGHEITVLSRRHLILGWRLLEFAQHRCEERESDIAAVNTHRDC